MLIGSHLMPAKLLERFGKAKDALGYPDDTFGRNNCTLGLFATCRRLI